MSGASALNQQLIERIHQAPGYFSLAVTGAGSRAVADLLSVAGASSSILEASVPYHDLALRRFLHARTAQGCNTGTARAMAMVAYQRARQMVPETEAYGLGCTAAIATDRARRGADRCHIALQSTGMTHVLDIELSKQLDRATQESICSELLLQVMARGLRLEIPPFSARDQVSVVEKHADADANWQALLRADIPSVSHESPALVFPGAFNPMHEGHAAMLAHAQQRLGLPATLEISIRNVDKPPLDYLSMQERLTAAGDTPVVFTNAPTFLEKSAIFPGATFIVGADTIERIADPVYYADETARDDAIRTMADRNVRFLVFGRSGAGGFHELDDLALGPTLKGLCSGVSEQDFRIDISSTQLRSG